MAEMHDIVTEVEALCAHCRPPLMQATAKLRWLQDWADDLKRYDLGVIKDGFHTWRRQGHDRFPTLGEIEPILDKLGGRRVKVEAPRVWRYEITAEEYDALSLRDKARHHRASAAHRRRRAGPMPINPPPGFRGKIDMPEAWHEHIAAAERHDAEARRLEALCMPEAQR